MSLRRSLLAVVALLALSAAPSYAEGTKLGLGYFRPEAPVGGRAWLSEKVALDLGFGFNITSPDTSDGQTGFLIDAGVPIVAAESGNAKFYVRPGLTFASTPNPTPSDPDNKTTQFWISGTFGVEYFFTDHFSIQAGHGVVFKSVDPDQGVEKYTQIVSEDFGLSSIGFHFYFN